MLMNKKKTLWIVICTIIVVAGGIGGYLFFKNRSTTSQTTSTTAVQTSTVKTGNLIISASGVGTIISNKDVKDPNGTISSLLSARLSILQAQQTYDSAVSSLPSDLATAEYDLLTAQATLRTDQATRAKYNAAKCDTETTQYYKDQYEMAQYQYEHNPSQTLESALDDARSSYYYCITPWPQTTIDEADATVKVDQQNVADLQAKLRNSLLALIQPTLKSLEIN